MDKITLVRKSLEDDVDLNCEYCVFYEACSQAPDLPYILNIDSCRDGDYWEFEEE